MPQRPRSRVSATSIGRLSERTGVNIETIRYYERIGLLPEPPRSEGHHRMYDATHGQRLAFIRRSRELGFSLGEIRQLLGLAGNHRPTCNQVRVLTEMHITDIRRKVKDLKRLERVLSTLALQCNGQEVPDCPILEALGDSSPPSTRSV